MDRSRRVRKDYGIQELTECLHALSVEIRSFREIEHLSQIELARRASVSKTTVNDLENEVATDLQLSTLFLLSKVLRKDPVEFLRPSDLKMETNDLRALQKVVEELKRIGIELQRLYRRLR